MEKNHVTHVNDGFVSLGHRIIRKRGARGRMSVVTTIPREKAKGFVRRLTGFAKGVGDSDEFTGHCSIDDLVWFPDVAQAISERFQHRILMSGHKRSLKHHVP